MSRFGEQVPGYLLGKQQLIATVAFTVLCSLVFLCLAAPFSDNLWFSFTSLKPFGMTVLYWLVAVLLLSLSKVLMYSRRMRRFRFAAYFFWVAAEILVVALLYAAFNIHGAKSGIVAMPEGGFSKSFLNALLYSFVCIGVPHAVCGMYFALQDKDNTIRVMNYGNVVSDVPVQPHEEKRITLFDNNGVLKFSINSESLYFIESDDNYIQVWYRDSNSEIKKYMLRCRLKTVEESFADSDLVRCHRKYIVNLRNVNILKSGKDGYQIDLGLDSIAPIPISKTYEQAVLARFNSR